MKLTRQKKNQIREFVGDLIGAVSLFAAGWLFMVIAYGLGY